MKEAINKPIRVVLVDDHPPLRIGLRILLEQADDIDVVGEAESGTEALREIETRRPDVAVIDCQLPDVDGTEVAAAINASGWEVKVLALSAHDDTHYIRGMLEAGAVGYLLKSEAPGAIVSAVRAAVAGKSWFSPPIAAQVASLARGDEQADSGRLTRRETEVLELLAEGYTNAQIAHALTISERTVAYHVENLFNKLGVNNRTEAVVEAIRRGWLEV